MKPILAVTEENKVSTQHNVEFVFLQEESKDDEQLNPEAAKQQTKAVKENEE